MTLSVSKDGYTTMRPRVRKSGEVVVYLVDVSFADLEGRRAITFTADASCTQLLPTVRARAYQAVITQSVAGPASMGGPST